jgi:hypothetical protein
MKIYYADIDKEEQFPWDLESKVAPSVPPSVSSKYKKTWRSASKATRMSRVKDYAAHMMEMEADERTKSSTTVLGHKKRKHGSEDEDEDEDKPTCTLSPPDLQAVVCKTAKSVAPMVSGIVKLTTQIGIVGGKVEAVNNNVDKLQANIGAIGEDLRGLKAKQQADTDILHGKVDQNTLMISQICGWMKSMNILGEVEGAVSNEEEDDDYM